MYTMAGNQLLCSVRGRSETPEKIQYGSGPYLGGWEALSYGPANINYVHIVIVVRIFSVAFTL